MNVDSLLNSGTEAQEEIPHDLALALDSAIEQQKKIEVTDDLLDILYLEREDIGEVAKRFDLDIKEADDLERFKRLLTLHEQTRENCRIVCDFICNKVKGADRRVLLLASESLHNFHHTGNHFVSGFEFDGHYYLLSPNNLLTYKLTIPVDKDGNPFNRLSLVIRGDTLSQAIESLKYYEGGDEWRIVKEYDN